MSVLCPAVPVCGTGRPRPFRSRLCVPSLRRRHFVTGLAQTVLPCHPLAVPGRLCSEEPPPLPAALWRFSSSASASLLPWPSSSLPGSPPVLAGGFPRRLPPFRTSRLGSSLPRHCRRVPLRTVALALLSSSWFPSEVLQGQGLSPLFLLLLLTHAQQSTCCLIIVKGWMIVELV